jgi:hypothetical protein
LSEFNNKPVWVSYFSTEGMAQIDRFPGHGDPLALQIFHGLGHILHLIGFTANILDNLIFPN